MPLPPALLGLLAVAALGLLGLRGLPAVLLLAPVLVLLLLAAPGSSHPHACRLDWVVPALLLGAQVCYLAAVGKSAHVPWAVTFVLVATIVLHYADACSPDRPAGTGPASERGSAFGWEGRMLLAGIAAATGIATVAYVAMAAYLLGLIAARIVTRSVALQLASARAVSASSSLGSAGNVR